MRGVTQFRVVHGGLDPADLLAEIDGPMLRHGLQERHGEQLMVRPRQRNERPDPELLAVSYERFLAAGA